MKYSMFLSLAFIGSALLTMEKPKNHKPKHSLSIRTIKNESNIPLTISLRKEKNKNSTEKQIILEPHQTKLINNGAYFSDNGNAPIGLLIYPNAHAHDNWIVLNFSFSDKKDNQLIANLDYFGYTVFPIDNKNTEDITRLTDRNNKGKKLSIMKAMTPFSWQNSGNYYVDLIIKGPNLWDASVSIAKQEEQEAQKSPPAKEKTAQTDSH